MFDDVGLDSMVRWISECFSPLGKEHVTLTFVIAEVFLVYDGIKVDILG